MSDPEVIERPYATESHGGDLDHDIIHKDHNDSDALVANDQLVQARSTEQPSKTLIINEKAQEMIDHFEADRTRAKEALLFAQVFQRRAYNEGRLSWEFEEGDMIVLNPHSLRLLKNEKGRGKKLLMKYDGPFEVIRKLSPITYQIRLPVSYGIHPIINIAHLEKYQSSPAEFGARPTKRLNRADFEELPEVEIERILNERMRKRHGGRRVREFKVRWKGFGPEDDEWMTAKALKKAPNILQEWEMNKGKA